MLLDRLRNLFSLAATALVVNVLGLSSAAAQGVIKDGRAKLFDHVYVIVLENHEFDDALNKGLSPFLRSLARDHGVAANYFGVTHPSLPNYLAMISGDDFGVADDNPSCLASDLRPSQPCHRLPDDSLVDQLEAAGLSFALYAESLPFAGSLQQAAPDGHDALYAQKHNPFAYFERIAANPTRRDRLKPLSAFEADLAGSAPNFGFIVPNQCHDGHGLPMCRDSAQLIRDYDAFVDRTVGMIRASPNWTQNSAIVITFDEGETRREANASSPSVELRGADSGDNHIATIVVTRCGGPVVSGARLDHYSLLATIEDGFRLPRLRKAKEAPSMMDLFDRPCR